jgi:hypothetical protein
MRTKPLLFAIALLISSPARAGLITFDPFPSIPGDVTVEYFSGGLTGPVGAVPSPNATALMPAQSPVPGGGIALLLTPGEFGLLLTFDTLQSSVSAIGGDFGGAPLRDNEILHLSLFGELGNFLGSISVLSPFAEPNLQQVSINLGSNAIRYGAFTYQNDQGDRGFYTIDNIAYDASVPEPLSFMLLGTGLLAIAGRRWARQRRAR